MIVTEEGKSRESLQTPKIYMCISLTDFYNVQTKYTSC